nr:hypothetical protein [Tanacetum cinerariifolium]
MDEEYARKLHKELNKDIDWDVATDHVEQKAKEDLYVQIYQEQIKEEENRAIKSINETPAQKAAKRRKLNEKVIDLKQNLEIVPDEDDDVYTEATLLARKIESMQEELLQFKLQDVWTLVDLPYGKRAIGSKWVFRNKLDERDFIVYQMDVKSAFLYGTIKEEDLVWIGNIQLVFLSCRLISWQCKKQTMVANSIIEAEYVAASSCYG